MTRREWFAPLAKFSDFLEQQAPRGNDSGVAGTQAFPRAVDHRPHAFLNCLILGSKPVDAGHVRGPLLLAIDQVLIRFVTHGPESDRIDLGMHEGCILDRLPLLYVKMLF